MQKFLSGILWVNIKSQVIITHQGANIGITEQKNGYLLFSGSIMYKYY